MELFGADRPDGSPFEIAKKWIEFAKDNGDIEVTAVNLATVDAQGLPNSRVVYVRGHEPDGLVFYTNYNSQKGRELALGKAAMNFYFPKSQRQIRLRGAVEKVNEAQSDAYFMGRPEGSRLGAWVSQQSQPLSSRAQMLSEWDGIDRNKADTRPPHWGGYKLRPVEIEFFVMGEFRLHDRFKWTRALASDSAWRVERLYP